MKITPEIEKLVKAAWRVRKHAYTPYYEFPVGAALLAEDGRIFAGCNVENSSGSAVFCAEVSALGAAVSAGARKFKALAVAGPEDSFLLPCGVCRQRLIEFGGDLDVYVTKMNGETDRYKLADLLPNAMKL